MQMTQGLLRRAIMWLVLLGHIGAIALSFALISQFDEALGIALTLLPVTATIFMFIVQFHGENFFGSDTDIKRVSTDAASLTIVLAATMVLSIHTLIVFYYYGRIGSVDLLQKGVSIL